MIKFAIKKQLALVVTSLTLISCSTQAQQAPKESATVELVQWNSDESLQRLARSSSKADFFPLTNNFTSQDNGLVCGLASSAIVLNALRLRKRTDLPVDKTSIKKEEGKYLPSKYNPYFPKYTQNNVLNEKTKKKIEVLGKPIDIKGEKKKDFGLQLKQLATVLESHGLKVQVRVVDENFNSERAKNEIIENLKAKDDYVLVNYKRKSLGQPGGGHISPVGAYDKESDSFLVMDVNPNKAPWVWVKSEDLISAMRTFDTVENRGYVLISDKK